MKTKVFVYKNFLGISSSIDREGVMNDPTCPTSIGFVIDDSNKRPQKTLFCVLENDDSLRFDQFQIRSIYQVAKMVVENGGKFFTNINDVAKFLNNQGSEQNV